MKLDRRRRFKADTFGSVATRGEYRRRSNEAVARSLELRGAISDLLVHNTVVRDRLSNIEATIRNRRGIRPEWFPTRLRTSEAPESV